MDVLNTGSLDLEKCLAGTVAFSVSFITCAEKTGETCISSQMRELCGSHRAKRLFLQLEPG